MGTVPPTRGPLSGRVAIVTGGASGIGSATAAALAERGARVVVADVRATTSAPPVVSYRPTDVTNAAHVQDLHDWTRREVGVPDALVISAGVGIHERLAEGDPEKWARVLDVNVMGALRVLRAFLPGMLDRGGGDVVVVSSVSSRRPHAWGGVYAASKAALDVVAEALRLEEQPRIRVTNVAPGIVDTPFLDRTIGHPGDARALGWGAIPASDVADAVVFALTRPRGTSIDEITVRPARQPH